MRKGSSFLTSDWFAGILIILFTLIIAGATDTIEKIDSYAYDIAIKASAKEPGEKIAVIGIDDVSIKNLGRWPWPRTRLADMITKLNEGGAKVIGLPIFLSEPQIDPGLAAIRDLQKYYGDVLSASAESNVDIAVLGDKLMTSESALNTDQHLADAMDKAKNVILPMQFDLNPPDGNIENTLPAYLKKSEIAAGNILDPSNAAENGHLPPDTSLATPPIDILGEKAAYIGHLANNADADGTTRTELLMLHYDKAYFPSLSLVLAAKSLNLDIGQISAELGNSVRIGKLTIKTDPYLQMHPFFYSGKNGKSAFQIDSFYDVVAGKIPLSKYKNKIVIIGPNAYGVGDTLSTPISSNMQPAEILAHTVASILNQHFIVTPEWGTPLRYLLILLAMAFVIFGLPKLKAGPAAWVSFGLVVGLIAAHFILLTGNGYWVQLMLPITLILMGYILITTKHYLVTEKAREKSDVQSAESNRQLGLALQQTGQLDMAFDKFRKCPMDESMSDVLYNLALDYERKRQFNKAVSVYQYIFDYDPTFRDLDQKLQRAQKLEETVILGGGAMSSAAATLILTPGNDEKPMLGRYQVEKELGKGAMGVVYLGRDPKINRVVAIKTLALKDEFEGDELVEIKERFFREAETAGRLNHPNIVTIYDAGEEHDLAYIAMEFLHGHDLSRYVKPDALLPIPKVVNITYKAALALDYAHQNKVVHRDIKPANIMFDPDKGAIKITDFGIARITDASKTKTGTVLGTPTYMSPEQVAGKKIDGRSDLYSLGVMFYQMLSGVAPFRGDSMATLMYKIANDSHESVNTVRPEIADILPCISGIIDKALAKDPDDRFQTGQEFAFAIKACIDACKKDISGENEE
jgi:CHASE2 domain-containing sensor protein